jgi:DNA-binding transcriptional regulator LsrR (DeoR family)
MSGPTRTRLERERDLQRISEGYLKGQTQAEIGEALGVSQSQISRDMRALRDRCLETSLRDFDEARALQLAKLD